MSGRVVVAGLGNPYRRDDGVGPAVAKAASLDASPGVVFTDGPADATGLLDLWAGARLCVLVDAVVTGAAAGTVHRVELHDHGSVVPLDVVLPAADRHSTHAIAIGEAVALGRALDRLPGRLVVVGVEAGDVGDGEGLTAPVAAALPQAVEAVLDEVRDEEEPA